MVLAAMEKTKVAGNQQTVLGNVLLFFLSPSPGYVGFFIPLADEESWDLTFLVSSSSCDPHSCVPSDLALSSNRKKIVRLVVGLVRGLLEIWQDKRNTEQKTLWMSF